MTENTGQIISGSPGGQYRRLHTDDIDVVTGCAGHHECRAFPWCFAGARAATKETRVRDTPSSECAAHVLTKRRTRTSRAGGRITLNLSIDAFHLSLRRANDRIFFLIKTKIDDFFDTAEYDWTPPLPGGRQRMYLKELFHWLMTVVDSLPLEDKYKDGAFKAAMDHVANSLMVRASVRFVSRE